MNKSATHSQDKKFVKWYFLPVFLMGFLGIFVGCQDESTIQTATGTDHDALVKLVDEDSALVSFEPNYNEGEDPGLGKISTQVYPFKVGQKMRLISRTLNVEFVGDTAYGVLTKNFEGVLYIKGSYDSNAVAPDTLISKAFSATVKRNIVFIRIGNSENPELNWRIAAISLPEGGTQSPNIDIVKLTAYLPGGDTLVINSPNDYYLVRHWGYWWRWHHIPVVQRNHDVTLRVELNSAYADTDFVTLTFGADRINLIRTKKKFDLVSSNFNGQYYEKVYEQTYRPMQLTGFYHVIVNAMPKQVVYDDATPVEEESWGVPYFVRP